MNSLYLTLSIAENPIYTYIFDREETIFRCFLSPQTGLL